MNVERTSEVTGMFQTNTLLHKFRIFAFEGSTIAYDIRNYYQDGPNRRFRCFAFNIKGDPEVATEVPPEIMAAIPPEAQSCFVQYWRIPQEGERPYRMFAAPCEEQTYQDDGVSRSICQAEWEKEM